MARKSKTVFGDYGRDKGKAYEITEMPARQAEWWGARVLSALARSGVEIPDDLASGGMAGIAVLGAKMLVASIGQPDVRPLLDEMFDCCVAIIPDAQNPMVKRGAGGLGPMTADDIEETKTLLMLRKEIIALHIDFFPDAARSILEKILGVGGADSPAT